MNAFANLALLLGVLLIAAGIAVALVTGLDLRFLIPSGAAVLGGAGLLWRFGSSLKAADSGAPSAGPQRSVQKPVSQNENRHSKIDRKL